MKLNSVQRADYWSGNCEHAVDQHGSRISLIVLGFI